MAGDAISTHLINRSIRGLNMSEMAIHIAMGEKFDLPEFDNSGDYVAIRFIGSRNGELLSISGGEEAAQSLGVESVSLFGKLGKRYVVANSNSDRVGYVIARAQTREKALSRCEKAIDKLRFEWRE